MGTLSRRGTYVFDSVDIRVLPAVLAFLLMLEGVAMGVGLIPPGLSCLQTERTSGVEVVDCGRLRREGGIWRYLVWCRARQ